MRTTLATTTYAAAFAAGLLLVGAGVVALWQARAEPAGQAELDSAFDAPEATEPVAVAEPVALPEPARRKPATPATLDCTDLRALFGLGESLDEAQKDYLQTHC